MLLLLVVVVVLLLLLLPLISLLQAGWQISVSADVVRAVALVFRLLTVTTSSGFSPARVVTSFVLGSF